MKKEATATCKSQDKLKLVRWQPYLRESLFLTAIAELLLTKEAQAPFQCNVNLSVLNMPVMAYLWPPDCSIPKS